MTGWDNNSGIRERLALLADRGPITLNPDSWGYNPSRDRWYFCGPARPEQLGTIEVRQEGSASLALIQERWNMDRREAMAFIDHAEATQ